MSIGALLNRGNLVGRPVFQCKVSFMGNCGSDRLLVVPFIGTPDSVAPTINTKYRMLSCTLLGEAAQSQNKATSTTIGYSGFWNMQVVMDYGDGDSFLDATPFICGVSMTNPHGSSAGTFECSIHVDFRKFDSSTVVYSGDE